MNISKHPLSDANTAHIQIETSCNQMKESSYCRERVVFFLIPSASWEHDESGTNWKHITGRLPSKYTNAPIKSRIGFGDWRKANCIGNLLRNWGKPPGKSFPSLRIRWELWKLSSAAWFNCMWIAKLSFSAVTPPPPPTPQLTKKTILIPNSKDVILSFWCLVFFNLAACFSVSDAGLRVLLLSVCR